MKSRSRRKSSLQWMDVAKVLSQVAGSITKLTNWSYTLTHRSQARLEEQVFALNNGRIANLQADLLIKQQRANKLSNEVVMSDARAELDREKILKQNQRLEEQIKRLELQNMELRGKLEAAGAFTPTFQADNYAEPGNVRNGQMYTSEDNNTFGR